ncbi:MAG: hypothetical protein M3539_02065 [Acidobacteriota bacterium]|nr:hypothetical protein [Acidobacteriota bacterium]
MQTPTSLVATRQPEQARKLIRWSWWCAIIVAACGLFVQVALAPKTDPLAVLMMLTLVPYAIWGSFWGFVWVRDTLLRRWFGKLPQPLVVVLVVVLFYLLLVIAVYYGVLGGGIYQYVKHRRLAKQAQNPPQRPVSKESFDSLRDL